MNCRERGCPFRMHPCPDHDGERFALFNQRKTMFHKETHPVVGPGYDRRQPRALKVVPLISREDRETKRVEDMLKDNGYQRPTILGYTLTYHATARLIVRQIDRSKIEDAIRRPRFTAPTKAGATKHAGAKAMCVIDHRTKEIVTVGYGLDYDEPQQLSA